MIDLKPEHLALVRSLFRRHIPDRQMLVFGSRVRSGAKPTSDLDLCIMGEAPLSLLQQGELREAFADSDLPMRVDIVVWSEIDEAFRKVLLATGVDLLRDESLKLAGGPGFEPG
ncbi:MAG: nucleotidyltransferase family protein [Alphaproteobacteria bacterium]